MKRVVSVIGAAGIGAGLMYLFDPDRGKRRRAMLRNQAEHVSRVTFDTAGKTKRDVQNHFRGLRAELESIFCAAEVTDEVLQARVRSKMGRVVSHPHAINVTVRDGNVILRGSILADEMHLLLNVISEVDGVKDINNWLEVHESADVPALQGGRKRHGERFGPFKTNWSPTMRLAATFAGGAMVIYGAMRRGFVGSGLGLAGTVLMTRALTNVEARKLVGIDGRSGEVAAETTSKVEAPLEHEPAHALEAEAAH